MATLKSFGISPMVTKSLINLFPTPLSPSHKICHHLFSFFFYSNYHRSLQFILYICEDRKHSKRRKKSHLNEHRRFLWGCLSISTSCLKSQPPWISRYQRREKHSTYSWRSVISFSFASTSSRKLLICFWWVSLWLWICCSTACWNLEGKRSKLD